jgi:hypothetical protein
MEPSYHTGPREIATAMNLISLNTRRAEHLISMACWSVILKRFPQYTQGQMWLGFGLLLDLKVETSDSACIRGQTNMSA